jgi:hypothetical protein
MQSKQFEMNKSIAIKAAKDAASNAARNYQIKDTPYCRRAFEGSAERYSIKR